MRPRMMGRGCYGMGPGMIGGRIALFDRMALFDVLDLTDEQQAKINKIQDEARRSHWALWGEVMDRQAELRDLHAAPKRTPLRSIKPIKN